MANSVSHVLHSTCLTDFRRDCRLVRWHLQFRRRVWVTVLKVISVNRSWSFRYGDFFGGCAVLGLCCCARAFSSWQGLVFIAVSGPLIVVASLVASLVVEHRLGSFGTQGLLPCVMWNLLRPGIEPVSPTLAGWFLPLDHQGSPGEANLK